VTAGIRLPAKFLSDLLFGTMDFGRLETTHTRALAWLLSGREATAMKCEVFAGWTATGRGDIIESGTVTVFEDTLNDPGR
jgi:hypothetical protein